MCLESRVTLIDGMRTSARFKDPLSSFSKSHQKLGNGCPTWKQRNKRPINHLLTLRMQMQMTLDLSKSLILKLIKLYMDLRK